MEVGHIAGTFDHLAQAFGPKLDRRTPKAPETGLALGHPAETTGKAWEGHDD